MAEDVNSSNTGSSQDGVIDLENLVRDIDKGPDGTSDAGNAAEVSGPGVQASRLASRLASSDEPTSQLESAQPSPKIQPKPTVSESPADEKRSTSSAVAQPEKPSEGGISEEDLDAVLMLESPELAIEMASIRDVAKSAGQPDSPSALDGESSLSAADGRLTIRQRIGFQVLKVISVFRGFQAFGKRAMNDSKGLLRELLVQSKVSAIDSIHTRKEQLAVGFSWFKSRTWQQRVSILLAFAVLGALLVVVAKISQGKLLPKTEREWIASFEEKADGVFTYERTDPFEDFNDPILHPEFVVVIERVVVNLARTPEAEVGSNPMAAFEFYIQTDNQESAIEVKDRNIAVRDVLARAVERMTYPELATEEGKQKLKLILRKDLNQIMTKGRVRRVYLKTIVLNPE